MKVELPCFFRPNFECTQACVYFPSVRKIVDGIAKSDIKTFEEAAVERREEFLGLGETDKIIYTSDRFLRHNTRSKYNECLSKKLKP